MNCANHQDQASTAFCRNCGKALCPACVRGVQGSIYCEECLAAQMRPTAPPPYASSQAPPAATQQGVAMPVGDSSANPVLALILSFIPGVGAIYNGQVVKGILHVGVFASLIWITDHDKFGATGIFIAFWVFYMAWDGWATARARHYGQPLPDPLSINRLTESMDSTPRAVYMPPQAPPTVDANATTPLAQQPPYAQPLEPATERDSTKVPLFSIIMIGAGVLLLLDTMGIFNVNIGQFWPVILILIGIWILVRRFYVARGGR